jgi:hypothetical protein
MFAAQQDDIHVSITCFLLSRGYTDNPATQQYDPPPLAGRLKTDMRFQKTSTLTEILAQGKLGSLQQRSSFIERLDTLLGFYLDQRLRQLVQVTAYQEGTLVLACANSTVAGQCRYLSRIYMQQLRQHRELCELRRISVVTAPTTPANRARSGQPRLRRLSPATAELLQSLSDDLGSGEISEALRRLARHVETAEAVKKDRSS